MNGLSKPLIAIYDAAIDDIQWQQALDAVNGYVGAGGASLQFVDFAQRSPFTMSLLTGLLKEADRSLVDFYLANHAALEAEVWAGLRTLPAGTLITDADFYPDLEELRSRPQVQYLINNIGIFRRMAARLNDNRSWYDAIAFQFASDLMEIPPGCIQRARELLPHLAKAFEMNRTTRQLNQLHSAVLAALDHVHVGICVVLEDASVVVANAEAQRIFSLADGIAPKEGKQLQVRDPATQDKLWRAISLTAKSARGANGLSHQSLLVERPSGNPAFVVDVAPLRDALSEIEHGLTGAIVTVIDPDNPRPFRIDRLSTAYGLSQAETNVCQHLIEGWSNQRIADSRNVTVDTVKTQVRSIMQKTGTHRRADLLRLVVQTSPPISQGDPT